MAGVLVIVAYARTANHPEAMLRIFATILEKTPSGGASREDLKEAYREAKDAEPSDRTIRRIIRRINLIFDPLAYGERPEPGETDERALSGEVEVEFTVRDPEEMIPWLMGWGPYICVLEPDGLRKALIKNLQETMRQYA